MKKLLFFVLLSGCFTCFSQEEKTTKADSLKTDKEPASFAIIENIPVYNGCDENKSNQEKKKCMSAQISSLVSENFNIKLANSLGLSAGMVRINVMFKIDKEGHVIDVKAKGPHPELEKEAIRVVNLIPKMQKPGIQRGKPVIVPYGFPIKLKIEDKPKEILKDSPAKIDKYPTYRGCNEDLDYLSMKKCTTDKIKNFIKLSFNIELAERLFPLEQSTQFLVEFIIDEKGKPKNIKVQAHKREIAAEAIKVVKRLPKFKKPGYLNGKPVAVPYKLLMTLYFL